MWIVLEKTKTGYSNRIVRIINEGDNKREVIEELLELRKSFRIFKCDLDIIINTSVRGDGKRETNIIDLTNDKSERYILE